MKAYVELIQRKERELGTDVLTHQKVSLTPAHLHLQIDIDILYSGVEPTMQTTYSRQ